MSDVAPYQEGRPRPPFQFYRRVDPSSLLDGPIAIRLQGVRREHEALGRARPWRHRPAATRRPSRRIRGLRGGELVPGFEEGLIDLGAELPSSLTPCLVANSSMASAFCLCQLAHQRRKVSEVADLMASRFCAGRPASSPSSMPRWAWLSSTCRAARSCPPPRAPSIAPSGWAGGGPRLGLHGLEVPLHAGHARERLRCRTRVQQGCLGQPAGTEPGSHQVGHSETFLRWWASWQKQNADAIEEFVTKHGVKLLTTPPEVNRRSSRPGTSSPPRRPRRTRSSRRSRSRSGPMPPRSCRPSASCSRLSLAADHYWPAKQ